MNKIKDPYAERNRRDSRRKDRYETLRRRQIRAIKSGLLVIDSQEV